MILAKGEFEPFMSKVIILVFYLNYGYTSLLFPSVFSNFRTYQFSSPYNGLLIEYYTTFAKPNTLQRALFNTYIVCS